MSVTTELENLTNKRGTLTAKAVVEFGRTHPRSVIGKSLTWDDAKAAEEYRELQACALIEGGEIGIVPVMVP